MAWSCRAIHTFTSGFQVVAVVVVVVELLVVVIVLVVVVVVVVVDYIYAYVGFDDW